MRSLHPFRFKVQNYDLTATLTCGQAFRWKQIGDSWESVVKGRWMRLSSVGDGILAETPSPLEDCSWLAEYLQIDTDLTNVLATFPNDEPMRAAVKACFGLRLLRQEPWECLASFILSSTKQIVQIQQIIGLLCERFGESVTVPRGHPAAYSFPTAERISRCSEAELRACKMGFRAAYLRETAAMIVSTEVNLNFLSLDLEEARESLLRLPGVGRKIADCVLLFAGGFQNAFPIDVWVMKALRELYFQGRGIPLKRLQRFAGKHFGPYAGYAQQYLFHYKRRGRLSE